MKNLMNEDMTKIRSMSRLWGVLTFLVLLGIGGIPAAKAQDTLAEIQKRGYVEIGIGAGGFPYAAVDQDGKPIGAAPEISIAALKQMGITDVRPQVVDWGALIPGLQAKRYDLVSTGMFMNPQRCQAVLFSKPDTCSVDVFMVPKGNPLNLHSLKDVAAHPEVKITMAPGSNEVRIAKEAGVAEDQMVTNTDVQSRLKLLQTGRVNVWIDPSDTFSALQNKDPNFEVIPVEGAQIACAGAAFRKEDATFRDAYDAALTKVQQSGEFTRILTKYGFPADIALKADTAQLCAAQ
ncbi:MAG TPA: ectoine/hydroxyectoine ABC transporter substrate-binding protein EhuB [Hypericibacter adhaerens]|jgi:polar amino acid transport system substrate-binding protein|uniref:ectoine/hydroxyectoine ABC transporter substrate-binding protein EhuB n=1 Tax=Hypericibacter adhaerens TaxID=2602016 RepID=UPI002C250A1D|nr:ectoine/hydroxyectoine ABC transporter substrate-binding protein EhuB [Hypericibacter adhaerens]HWA45457.1 ectoine/hydroxyectoine ABC transporter substrate-binding protein EhuB [Hypericibacter adhaerens]